MTISIKDTSTTRKVAVKVMLQGGYKIIGGESWSNLMTPAQRTQYEFTQRQLNRAAGRA